MAGEILGTGCRESEGPDGVVLDFWVPAGRARPEELRAALGAAGIGARVEAHPEGEGWRTAMHDFHRPVEVAGRLLVRPPWSPPRAGLLDVEIEIGMAFGTAQHATTRTCLEMLAALAPAGAVLDAGCGTGVLAIAARRLGFGPVAAIDFDPLCVAATVANARRNGVALTVARRTIGADPVPRCDVLLANLTATVLAELARALPAPAPGVAILSGLRPEEVAAATAAFAASGLAATRVAEDEGWATVLMERA